MFSFPIVQLISKVHDKGSRYFPLSSLLSAASLRLGLRRWEYPLHRSLLQCGSSSWSCCTASTRRERSVSAAAEWANRGQETLGYLPRLSHIDLSLFFFLFPPTASSRAPSTWRGHPSTGSSSSGGRRRRSEQQQQKRRRRRRQRRPGPVCSARKPVGKKKKKKKKNSPNAVVSAGMS